MSLPADPLLIADDIYLSDTPGQTTGAPPDVVVRSRRSLVLHRLRRNRSAMAGLIVLVLLFLAAFLGPVVNKAITGWSYTDQDFTAFLQPPSANHWFGTTQIGGGGVAPAVRGVGEAVLVRVVVGPGSTSPGPGA